ncbi:MAG: hypothetical protein QM765_29910 [Myxococcales bacterium]
MPRHLGGSRQPELFPRSTRPTISIAPDHSLAVLERTIDWTELEERAQLIRSQKLKSSAGKTPHLRALNGAMVLGAGRSMSYREAEDQIRHYGPARLLCGLTETDWTPDHNTIHGYATLMGPEGMQLFNEYAVGLAAEMGLADPSVMVADTTAQEAAIPHPTEMGLMSKFLSAVGTASKRAGGELKQFASKIDDRLKEAQKKVREFRLFAKTRETRAKLLAGMARLAEGVHSQLGEALAATGATGRKYEKVAQAKLAALHETMETLLPQIRYWLRTGRVAAGKIINLHIPELHSIVRGKTGKVVEFGLKWGVSRIKGGFILLRMESDRLDLHDSDYCLQAVRDHKEFFGKAPRSYGYDRGGWSQENVKAIRKEGVRDLGLAPRGKAKWCVSGITKQRLVNERAQVEGSIGTIKSPRYGFNRPRARSVEMMGFCGQRAALGANLNKLVRGLMKQRRWQMVG